jgi:co-chaperonin GroES (HSP10)
MKIKLMNSWIQIRKEESERRLGSLIILEDNSADRVGHTVGVVVALPSSVSVHKVSKENGTFSGKRLDAEIDPKSIGLSIGARVLFRKYLADQHELDDGTCLIHWQDILAIVPDGGKISNL